MSVLRNQAGNTIVLVLGAALVTGVILMETWRRSYATERRADEALVAAEVEMLLDPLRARLKSPETCEALLRGVRLSPGERRDVKLNFSFDDAALSGIAMTMAAVEIDRGPDMDTLIEIEGELTPFVRYQARLQTQFEAKTADGKTVMVTRAGRLGGLPFLAWVDRDGWLKSCFGSQSAGALCNDLGGYFFSRLPEGEGYDQSCRQSLHTRRLIKDGGATQIGTCRLAKGGASASSCERLYGSDRFKPFRFQDGHEAFSPEIPTARYMCLQCQ